MIERAPELVVRLQHFLVYRFDRVALLVRYRSAVASLVSYIDR